MSEFGVGFDFDHTLGLDNGLERNAFYEISHEFGIDLDRNDETSRAEIEELLACFRRDEMTLDAAVVSWLREHGAAVDGREREVAERYRAICFGLVARVTPIDGAREVLAALRERAVPVAILTNGWSPLQQKKIEVLGFDGPVLVSDQLGCAKPAPYAFERLAQALGLPPERCWYVGDNPRGDIGGALSAGMRAVWLDEGVPYPDDVPPPTARIERPQQLLALLPEESSLARQGGSGEAEKRAATDGFP